MLAILSEPPVFGVRIIGYSGQKQDSKKQKKLLRLSDMENHNSFCVIVGGFIQKYCIKRYRKEQEKL